MNSTSRWIVPIVILGLFAWLFAEALFGGGLFAFRDAAHFYYPLFQFCAEQWAAGRVPLWNPYENLGQPLAAGATSSVFYPGKLIFALPLDYAWAYKIYILAHLLLAAWAAYRLARHFGASGLAAGVCAISYAFSGNVLFQYCNVVFLVGAAWLPLAMLAADRMLVEGPGVRGEGRGARDPGRGRTGPRRARWAVGFGVVLALMVLGGDPQMAYHAGLLAAMYALWRWWHASPLSLWKRVAACVKRSGGGEVEQQDDPAAPALVRGRRPAGWLRSRPALLMLAAATGWTLSAVQVLPSIEFTRRSGRVADRSLDGLLCRNLRPGTHHEHTYQFSVGPWRLAEYVWPNFSGRQFPVHRRWLEVVPAEGRIWTPSLYMGLLPLLLALSAMRFRGRRNGRGDKPRGPPTEQGQARGSSPGHAVTRDCWLTWFVILAVLASFGWYGLGWLIGEIRLAAGGGAGGTQLVGPPCGGLYWLLTLLLPGYAYFRYPAKLLVVAALGLSLLAARGWDRTLAGPSDRFRGCLLWLGGVSVCGAIAAWAIRPFWGGWLSGVEPDVLFGPLDAGGAAHDLVSAWAQTAMLCGLYWWLLGRTRRLVVSSRPGHPVPADGNTKKGTAPSVPRWVPAAALFLVAVDLGWANRWMVICAPARQWEEESKLAAETEKGSDPFSRVFRHPIWMRPVWKSSGSPARLAEAMRWDRDTLWPKYNLAPRLSLAEVHGTMMPLDYAEFLRAGTGGPPLSLAKYVILPGDKALAGAQRIDVDVEDVSLWENAEHLPRAWIVHQVEMLPPLESHDPAELRRRTERVLYAGGQPRDLRNSAVVEDRGAACPAELLDADRLRPGPAGRARLRSLESCRIVHYDPLRVEIEAVLARPGLVVLCDQFYPGWRLEVETAGQGTRRVPILRANRVMRGAWLPAGRHRLTFQYRPADFVWGAALSGLGWVLTGCWLAWRPRT